MSRQIRKKSGTCIYHIILRGINDQKRSVFLCPSGSKRPEVEQPLCKAKNRPRDYTAVPKSTPAPLNVAFKLSANEITSVDSTEYYGAYIY